MYACVHEVCVCWIHSILAALVEYWQIVQGGGGVV